MRVTHEMPKDREEWRLFMRNYLKALMMLRGQNYDRLAAELSSKFGMPMSAPQLRHLVNQGTFRAEFFLKCASAMKVESLDVPQFKTQETHANRNPSTGENESIRKPGRARPRFQGPR